jgi:hypothetical protein
MMDTRRSVGPVFMLESIRDFGGYILNQGPSKGDVEKLRTAADCKEWKLHVSRGLNERDLGFVACEVGFAASRRTGLSIQRRLYIFAAGEEQPVNAGEDRANGTVAGKRWHDEWYQSCTFECSDVGAVEPDAMELSVAGIGSGGHSNDGRCPGRAD